MLGAEFTAGGNWSFTIYQRSQVAWWFLLCFKRWQVVVIICGFHVVEFIYWLTCICNPKIHTGLQSLVSVSVYRVVKHLGCLTHGPRSPNWRRTRWHPDFWFQKTSVLFHNPFHGTFSCTLYQWHPNYAHFGKCKFKFNQALSLIVTWTYYAWSFCPTKRKCLCSLLKSHFFVLSIFKDHGSLKLCFLLSLMNGWCFQLHSAYILNILLGQTVCHLFCNFSWSFLAQWEWSYFLLIPAKCFICVVHMKRIMHSQQTDVKTLKM